MFKFKLAKLLKILMVTALIVLCLLIIWAIVLYVLGLNLQWWAKAMILTCLAATILITILLRKLFLKRREMKFVDGIIGPEHMPGNISALDDASRELRRRFKQAVATLKKSHLKRKGDPLYVLPWYLIVGRSGSGKSTAIKSARLPSPFGDINRVSGIEGTRNCDWWFFDDSVVIDIAGRYSIHSNEELDKQEWRSFLEHLTKYRKKEPINGVIVTVEADALLEINLEKIEDEGRTLRKRIDEVTSVMGAKFPVYLLVTKTDLIFGINRYCELLSESSVSQAMGLLNHDGVIDIEMFVHKTVDTVTEKLKDIRLILANRDEVRGRHYIEPEVLLFPNEFERLRNGLKAFCKGAFKDNPFQELPFLRGIYFCSGRQEGQPVNSMAEHGGHLKNPELPGSGNGFFLFDFFSKILPGDRSLYSMTRSAKEWNKLTHNLWLTGFVTIVLIFCILLTYSWNENKAIINIVSPEYKKTVLFTDDSIEDIGLMARFSREINAVEERNRSWKIPRLGLYGSIELEKILKKKYCDRFRDHFDADINRNIESRVANGGWAQNDYAPAIQYIPFIVRRINMIQAKFNGADADQLAEMPAPDFAMMVQGDQVPFIEDGVAALYKQAYINYLVWQSDVETLNTTLSGLRRMLQNYFLDNKGDLRWLTAWVNQTLPEQAITLNHFWHGNKEDSEFVSIEPAFTVEGRKRIGDFVLNELDKAVEQTLWVVKPKENLISWYKEAFYGTWLNFVLHFGQAKAMFTESDQRDMMIERLTTDESPYLELLATMEDQLGSVDDDKWPGLKLNPAKDQLVTQWIEPVKRFGVIRKAVAGEMLSDNKATEKLTQRLSQNTRIAGELAMAGLGGTQFAKGKDAYKQYLEALKRFSGITTARGHAFAVAKEGFEDNMADTRSALMAAQNAVKNIQLMLTPKDGQPLDKKQDPFWQLINEPLDELWRYTVQQAACHLQTLWDQEVIVKIEGVYERQQLVGLLFGSSGLSDKFIEKHASPFLVQTSMKGYYSKKVRDCAIPFKESYFNFLKKGRQWNAVSSGSVQNQVVNIVAFPTDVNIEARIKPHMTRLVLEGRDGNTVLENKQYPIEKQFHWSASQSGDVTLQIMLGDITLTRKYSGYNAFGKFLREFRRGKRTFTVNDFPDYRHEFQRLGVFEIEVVYQLQPDQIMPIIRMLNTAPGGPPGIIITCSQTGLLDQ